MSTSKLSFTPPPSKSNAQKKACVCHWGDKCSQFKTFFDKNNSELGQIIAVRYSDTCKFANFYEAAIQFLHIPTEVQQELKQQYEVHKVDNTFPCPRIGIARFHFPYFLALQKKVRWTAPMSRKQVDELGIYMNRDPPPQQDRLIIYNPELGEKRQPRAKGANNGEMQFRIVPCETIAAVDAIAAAEQNNNNMALQSASLPLPARTEKHVAASKTMEENSSPSTHNNLLRSSHNWEAILKLPIVPHYSDSAVPIDLNKEFNSPIEPCDIYSYIGKTFPVGDSRAMVDRLYLNPKVFPPIFQNSDTALSEDEHEIVNDIVAYLKANAEVSGSSVRKGNLCLKNGFRIKFACACNHTARKKNDDTDGGETLPVNYKNGSAKRSGVGSGAPGLPRRRKNQKKELDCPQSFTLRVDNIGFYISTTAGNSQHVGHPKCDDVRLKDGIDELVGKFNEATELLQQIGDPTLVEEFEQQALNPFIDKLRTREREKKRRKRN